MTNLVYYQPWSVLNRLHREIDESFRGSDALQSAETNSTAWRPSVDLQEEQDRFVLRADVPGVSAKDIEVSTEDGTLTVRGERPARERVGSDAFEHIERATGTFLRRFTPSRIRHSLRQSMRAMPMAYSRSKSPSSLGSRPSEFW